MLYGYFSIKNILMAMCGGGIYRFPDGKLSLPCFMVGLENISYPFVYSLEGTQMSF